MKGTVIILAAFCVAFTMVASASAAPRSDYVTRGLLCIHNYEGSWTDGGSPYYGGLQMDYSFQKAYGWAWSHTVLRVAGRVIRHTRQKVSFIDLWGTADHWPIWAQLEAGRNGYRARGWYPWPNTARYCGLL